MKLIPYLACGFDAPQFIEYGCKLIPQGFIHPRIPLNYDLAVKAFSVAVLLLGQTRQRNGYIDLLVFFGRNSETDRDVSPPVVIVSVLDRKSAQALTFLIVFVVVLFFGK